MIWIPLYRIILVAPPAWAPLKWVTDQRMKNQPINWSLISLTGIKGLLSTWMPAPVRPLATLSPRESAGQRVDRTNDHTNDQTRTVFCQPNPRGSIALRITETDDQTGDQATKRAEHSLFLRSTTEVPDIREYSVPRGMLALKVKWLMWKNEDEMWNVSFGHRTQG